MTPSGKTIPSPGTAFGSWVTLEQTKTDKYHHAWVQCRCVCGRVKFVLVWGLTSGHSKSCGCLSRHNARETRNSGYRKSDPLKISWANMRARCLNPHAEQYRYYGGKGIKIDPNWDSFAQFREWAIRNGYRQGLTIGRKNNDKDYCPDNCAWETRKEQARNRTTSRMITAFGETKNLVAWQDDPRMRVDIGTFVNRMRRGIPTEDAMSAKDLRFKEERKRLGIGDKIAGNR